MLFLHQHLVQEPFSLWSPQYLQSSILPLFISSEEEILLSSQLLWVIICYSKNMRFKEKQQECLCTWLSINFIWDVRVSETKMKKLKTWWGTFLKVLSLSCGHLHYLISLILSVCLACTYFFLPWQLNCYTRLHYITVRCTSFRNMCISDILVPHFNNPHCRKEKK